MKKNRQRNKKNAIVKDYSRLSLYISFATLIVTLILGVSAIQSSKMVAVESGVFRKPLLEAYIGKSSLFKKKKIRLLYGISEKKEKEGLIISPYTLKFQNSGKKTLKNLYISFVYHEWLRRDVFEQMVFKKRGTYIDGGTKQYSRMGNKDYITYLFKSLNPLVGVALNEPLALSKTSFTDAIKVRTGESLAYKVNYRLSFEINFSAENFPETTHSVEYEVVYSDSMKDLLYKFNLIAHDEIKAYRAKTGFFEYLGLFLFHENTNEVVLVYPDLKKIEFKNGIIFTDDSLDMKSETMAYDLVQWKYLL